MIKAIMQFGSQWHYYRPAPKHAGLSRTIIAYECVHSGLWHRYTRHGRTMARAEKNCITTYPVDRRMLGEVLANGHKCARQIQVIAIEKRNDIPGGQLQSFVDCVRLSAVGLAD